MAAMSVIGSTLAQAVPTLNLYYGQDLNYANSNNGIIVGSGFNASGNNIGGSKTNATGGLKYFKSSTEQIVSQTAPTTITVPLGDYLSLAIDALVTGNPNPDAGLNSTGQPGATQPAYLGLARLALKEDSTDATGSILTPISTDYPANPITTYDGESLYYSTSVLNSSQAARAAHTDRLNQNSSAGTSYNVVPNWENTADVDPRADVAPNEPGYDPGHGNGSAGLINPMYGGSDLVNSTTPIGIAEIEQFASSNNVANYESATDFYNSLIFQAKSPGSVILTPDVNRYESAYWTLASQGTNATVSTTGDGSTTIHAGVPSQYDVPPKEAFENVNTPPNLVIVVSNTVPEPASLGLLAVGGLALMARRNRVSTS